MTEQKKIREETAQAIRLGICAYQHLGFGNAEMYYKIADEVLKVQSLRDVVVKVDRELPKTLYHEEEHLDPKWVEEAVKNDMLNAGYVAVEPLIEE